MNGMKPMLTVDEAAIQLGIRVEDVHDLIETNAFPAFGKKKNLIRSADIISFVFPHKKEPQNKQIDCSMRLIDVLDEMLETKKGGISAVTYDNYEYAAKHIRNGLGNSIIGEIRPRNLELFYQSLKNRRSGQMLSNCSVQLVRKVLNMVFKYAINNGYITESSVLIIQNAKVKKGYRTNKDSKFLSKDNVATLLNILQGHPRYYTLIRLLVSTGLRIGEALALKYSDFDRKNGILKVNRALSRGALKYGCSAAREVIVTHPKSESSYREIKIPTEVFDLIDNWKQYNKKVNKDLQYVFLDKHGNLIAYRSLLRNFNLYLKRRKPQSLPRVTFHMLRHTYGSLLLEKGIPLPVVSKQLGHESIDITADIYITITHELNDKVPMACNDFLKEIDDKEIEDLLSLAI